jgi:hypothetical protein
MIHSTKIAPPYSQIVIADPTAPREVPDWKNSPGWPDVVFAAVTDSCILFACFPEMDGETTFKLGSARELDPGTPPVFLSILKTPGLMVALETVEGARVLEMPTLRRESTIRIWTNRANQPDEVFVGVE